MKSVYPLEDLGIIKIPVVSAQRFHQGARTLNIGIKYAGMAAVILFAQ
jgi:hypothetical protein